MNPIEILRLEDVGFYVKKDNKEIHILKNINFSVLKGEIFGITGESGSGKTTLGKIICGLENPTYGKKYFYGKEFAGIEPERKIQFLFQNYVSSHDPIQKIDSSFDEILSIMNIKSNKYKIKKEILNMIDLGDDLLSLFPINLSGGQLQRLAIAKLLLVQPHLIILDEPFASQDISSVLNLIKIFLKLNQKLKMTLICISHDIPYLLKICDRILIMKDGEIVEIIGIDKSINKYDHPTKTYSKFLFQAFDLKF